MAPPASAAAPRRAPARPTPRPAPSTPRRPPLRLFEPAPRRKPGARAFRRSTMWLSGVLILGSLLAVVAGDAFITQGQVRLTATQRALAGAEAQQKALQIAVARKAAPPVVVSQAKSEGLVAAAQVVYLPQVPLNVPLPPPRIVPAPAGSARSSPIPPSNVTPPKPQPKAPPTTAAASTVSGATAGTTGTGAASPTTPTTATTATTATR